MISENSDRVYLERTHKIAEKNALPEIFQTLFAGGIHVLDESFNTSLVRKQEKILRERLSTEPWADKGIASFDLSRTFPASHGIFTVEYDSEIDRNLLRCLKQNAYPDADEEVLLGMVKEQLKDYRRMTAFTLENEKHRFDMREYVPEDWSVYARILSNAPLTDTPYANTEFHFIMSPQPIDSRLGINGLVHEIAHVIEDKELTQEKLARGREARERKSMSLAEKKELIQCERKANAFVLGALRHFFGPEDMDLLRQLTYTALSVYHRMVASR